MLMMLREGYVHVRGYDDSQECIAQILNSTSIGSENDHVETDNQ
jgi:hypothetical protein